MRILIATGIYPPESGGPATYAKLLNDELPKRGIDVDVLAFRDVRHLPSGIRHIAYAWKVFLRGRLADAVYAQDTLSVGLPARIANVFLRKPLIVRVPGDHSWEQGTQRFGISDTLDEFPVYAADWPLMLKLMRRLQFFVVRDASALVVPSNYVGGIVAQWGVSASRIHTIYSGIAMPVGRTDPEGVPASPRIITVARLVPWKGVDALIDVVAKEAWWQLIVGDDGPLRKELEGRAIESGAVKRVHFLGRLPHDEMMGWIAAADVFVLNSTYEGLSHLLVEAMSLGIPVVATRVGGNPELIEDGVTGVLVPPSDKVALHAGIKKVLADKVLARKLGDAGRERTKKFSIDSSVDSLVDLLHTL